MRAAGGRHLWLNRGVLAIVDGALVPVEEATVPATDEGLLRGDGVFEVVRLYGGRPYAFDDHLARMERSARNLRLPLDVDAVRADALALLEAADVPAARAAAPRGHPRRAPPRLRRAADRPTPRPWRWRA